MSADSYTVAARHAIDLGSGRVVLPDSEVKASDLDLKPVTYDGEERLAHDAGLIEAGLLVKSDPKAKAQPSQIDDNGGEA